MLIEDKVQIEAVKTRSYMMGEIDGKVMITQGRYIVFVKKEDFLLDIDKQKKLPEDGVKHFSAENIQSQMRAAKLSNRMLTTGKSILRAIRDEETGEYAWFDNKYLKMFDGCTPNLIKYPGNSEYYDAVFTRYGEIKGGERANKDAVDYIAEKYNIKERIPGGD